MRRSCLEVYEPFRWLGRGWGEVEGGCGRPCGGLGQEYVLHHGLGKCGRGGAVCDRTLRTIIANSERIAIVGGNIYIQESHYLNIQHSPQVSIIRNATYSWLQTKKHITIIIHILKK